MFAPIDTARFRSPLALPLVYTAIGLTNDNLAVFREVILRHLEVEWCRSLSYAARNVVMGTVAGAEPAAEIAGLADGNASKMSADTCMLLASSEPCAQARINGPSMISHSGFFTRAESGSGSRSASHFVSSASLISSSVRCRMKTGLPRHLIMTCAHQLPFPRNGI